MRSRRGNRVVRLALAAVTAGLLAASCGGGGPDGRAGVAGRHPRRAWRGRRCRFDHRVGRLYRARRHRQELRLGHRLRARHRMQGQRQGRGDVRRDGGADERGRLRSGHRIGRREPPSDLRRDVCRKSTRRWFPAGIVWIRGSRTRRGTPSAASTTACRTSGDRTCSCTTPRYFRRRRPAGTWCSKR